MAMERMFEGMTFKLASPDERDRALALRRSIYLQEFSDEGLDQFDEVGLHLVGLNADGRVVAAARLIPPEHRPFDLERHVSLSGILAPERAPAEIGRFCVDAEYRKISRDQFVHLGMLKLIYVISDRRRITDLLTLGLPSLRNVYKAAFFTPLDIMCSHNIGNTLVQLMHCDLIALRTQHAGSRHPLARLLLHSQLPNIIG